MKLKENITVQQLIIFTVDYKIISSSLYTHKYHKHQSFVTIIQQYASGLVVEAMMSVMGKGGDGVVRHWSNVSYDWGSVDDRSGVVTGGLVDYRVETGIIFYN